MCVSEEEGNTAYFWRAIDRPAYKVLKIPCSGTFARRERGSEFSRVLKVQWMLRIDRHWCITCH
jgi:hypothetical protein